MDPTRRCKLPRLFFSDPAGKRWPRLRLALLIGGIAIFLGAVLFVSQPSSLRRSYAFPLRSAS